MVRMRHVAEVLRTSSATSPEFYAAMAEANAFALSIVPPEPAPDDVDMPPLADVDDAVLRRYVPPPAREVLPEPPAPGR